MDNKDFFMDLSKLTDKNIDKAKQNKKDSEYTTLEFVKDLTDDIEE